MWHVEVPMIKVSCPGSQAFAAGTVAWASMFAAATAMPSGRPVNAAASAVNEPTRSPGRATGCGTSSSRRENPGAIASRTFADGYEPSTKLPL